MVVQKVVTTVGLKVALKVVMTVGLKADELVGLMVVKKA
jgi:hypothetical protein